MSLHTPTHAVRLALLKQCDNRHHQDRAVDKQQCRASTSLATCLAADHSPIAAAGHFAGAEAAAPQTVAIEHAVNMLMARVAFDLLRSPRFKQYVMTYVQKKLDDLKVPDYINALQVRACLVPTLLHCRCEQK